MSTARARSDALEIETLALSEAELLDRVRDLEIESAALRETLRASLTMLHSLQEQNARLRSCLRRDLWQRFGKVAERPKAERRAAAA